AGEDIVIYGDGGQTRDFVHVSDVVHANVAAMEHGGGEVFNVATGSSVTVLELAENIVESVGNKVEILYEDERVGDVRDSRADVGKISGWWKSEFGLSEGIKGMLS
ncbi:MAG: GDP-mannose 4,6-dehydratase, partial [Candidatus Aenigmarchaeota archaeon]|nr:GDP-mannose 4,6-dehydratase [Candidatus Aenigmarchaeota archaeon]